MPIPETVRNRKFYFTADELPAEARQYLVKMLTVQLQSEYGDAPDRSGAVCPTVEDKTWLDLQLSQEKEHGLGVAQMLRSLGVDPTAYIKEAEGSVTEGSRKLDYFRMRMENWVERTLTRVLAERTGAIQTVAGLGTWFVPLALWHAKNYGDEALGHTVQGVRYTRRLIEEGRAAECQRAADKFYPWCLDIFGGVGTPNERKYLELGIKTLTNNQTRRLWMRSLQRDLDALGLRLPPDPWQGDRHHYPEEPDAALQVYLDVDEVPAATRPWLAKLLRGWVQAKYARQNDPIVFSAPTPEEKVATGHQLRDERALGLHVARFLRALGEDPDALADEAERTLAGGRAKVDFLKQPLGDDWVETCPQQMLWARANMLSSLACFGSCLVPFAAWAGMHYRAHEGFFAAWRERTRGLLAAGHHEAVQAAVDKWYRYAVDVFGRDGSPNEERYCALGIKTAQNGHVRQIFIDFVAQDLADLGLRAPDLYQGVRARYAPFPRPERAGVAVR
ncbi:MAG TPA: Phenylacetic acid catabolic protein [Chloroflexota bacterium]|nr:Phenylacetic acid catabolic protein [Chloroflexota bacterium]